MVRDLSVGQCVFKALADDGSFRPRLPFVPQGRRTPGCRQLTFPTTEVTMQLSESHLSQEQVKWVESQFPFFKNTTAASFLLPEPGRARPVVTSVPFPVAAPEGRSGLATPAHPGSAWAVALPSICCASLNPSNNIVD